MKVVVFGLTISSTWGNGHATLWRALCGALSRRGHRLVFYERDVPYYAQHRDAIEPEGCDLRLYEDWRSVAVDAARELRSADAAVVTSYCPDAVVASSIVLDSPARVKTFYDMDTPVTLKHLDRGEHVFYLPPGGLGGFDLVFSFTGGAALRLLRERLGAVRVAPLYGCVDSAVHRPAVRHSGPRAVLSYLGTYAADRQDRLERLFLEPARRLPGCRFLLAGSQYPADFPWQPNLYYVPHVPAGAHAAFFADARLTLNITRGAMAELGYCPSPRLFEAAACGSAVLSDRWEGLEQFFTPGAEILVAEGTEDVLSALDRTDAEISRIAAAARERTLAEHTAERRAQAFEEAVAGVTSAGRHAQTTQV